MARVESSVEIVAPIEKVFAFIANPKNYEKIFVESEVKIEMLSKDPIGVGTRYRQSAVLGGRKVDFHSHEYVEFEENHRFTDHDINGKLKREDITFRFDITDRGTKVTGAIDYALPYSVLGMLIGKLMGLEKAFNNFLKRGLENAKKILEA
ncbi:MAG: SRPBCC family protein [Promethearchaeota archaeon]